MRPGSSLPGFTLIELMIAVAILGIAAVAVGGHAEALERRALDEEQWTRAWISLEYEALALSTGRRADPVVRAALLEGLPGGGVDTRLERGWGVVRVRWLGRKQVQRSRELRVFTLAGGR